jgi:hypothetical protein
LGLLFPLDDWNQFYLEIVSISLTLSNNWSTVKKNFEE